MHTLLPSLPPPPSTRTPKKHLSKHASNRQPFLPSLFTCERVLSPSSSSLSAHTHTHSLSRSHLFFSLPLFVPSLPRFFFFPATQADDEISRFLCNLKKKLSCRNYSQPLNIKAKVNTINVSLPFVHPFSLLGAFAINIRIPTQGSVCFSVFLFVCLFVCLSVFGLCVCVCPVCTCLHCLSDQHSKPSTTPLFLFRPLVLVPSTTLLFPPRMSFFGFLFLCSLLFLFSLGAFLSSRLFFRIISPSSSTHSLPTLTFVLPLTATLCNNTNHI